MGLEEYIDIWDTSSWQDTLRNTGYRRTGESFRKDLKDACREYNKTASGNEYGGSISFKSKYDHVHWLRKNEDWEQDDHDEDEDEDEDVEEVEVEEMEVEEMEVEEMEVDEEVK